MLSPPRRTASSKFDSVKKLIAEQLKNIFETMPVSEAQVLALDLKRCFHHSSASDQNT
jgi:hypothetical protein